MTATTAEQTFVFGARFGAVGARGTGWFAVSAGLDVFAFVNRQPTSQLIHMTVRTFQGIAPSIGARAYVDESAVVIGRVTLGEDSSIWPSAVLRGDVHEIHVGARTSIQDGSVLHVTHDSHFSPGGRACIVGSDVTVGHRVVLHACTVGNLCLIGMGSVILDEVIIEDQVIVGAGSVVSPGKRLESRGLYVGSPARRVRDLKEQEMAFLPYSAAHYVKLKDDYLV